MNRGKELYLAYYTKKIGLVTFLKHHQKSKIKHPEKYPRYLTTAYGIEEPQTFHEKLTLSRWFELADLDQFLNSYTVADLKFILKQNGLSQVGKKAELIQRVKTLDNRFLDEIRQSNGLFVATPETKSYITRNYLFYSFHVHAARRGVELQEFLEMYYEIPFSPSFNDICWCIYNRRYADYVVRNLPNSLAWTRYKMAQLLDEENKEEMALRMYIEFLYRFLSGYDDWGIKDFKHLGIAPATKVAINRLSEHFNREMLDSIYGMNIPTYYFTNDVFEEILFKLLNGEDVEIKDYEYRTKNSAISSFK